ncbi:hypothetical protein EK904_005524, partial [Melospiza melodia maxima]
DFFDQKTGRGKEKKFQKLLVFIDDLLNLLKYHFTLTTCDSYMENQQHWLEVLQNFQVPLSHLPIAALTDPKTVGMDEKGSKHSSSLEEHSSHEVITEKDVLHSYPPLLPSGTFLALERCVLIAMFRISLLRMKEQNCIRLMAQGKVLRQVKGCKILILKAGIPPHKNPGLSRNRSSVAGVNVQLNIDLTELRCSETPVLSISFLPSDRIKLVAMRRDSTGV